MKDEEACRKRFTEKELKRFDGKDGRPAYVAFQGKVYDVSGSRLWQDGRHQGRHIAGDDLTEHMVNAPHGEETLTRFRVVGALSSEEAFKQRFFQRIEKLHLHPILVHFSIAYSIAVPLLSILYIITDHFSFELASYYLLALGFLAAPAAGLSGFFSWKVTYEGRMSKIFARKIFFTVLLNSVVAVCFVLRTLIPNVLITRTKVGYIYLGLLERLVPLDYIYFGLILSLVPIATVLGYYGGKIVYS